MSDSDEGHFKLKPRQGFTWRRSLFIVGLLAGGMATGAAGLAIAATAPGHFGWSHGPRLAIVQHVVLSALDSVGATAAQEARVHDIIATTVTQMGDEADEHAALRKQVIELLRAPTVDRAAIEKLRADQVAKVDAMSKTIVGSLLEAADQLTPEQRVKLADRAEEMMQHGPMGGRWGGPGDASRHPFMNGEHGSDDGPDFGPDNRPDKG